MKTDRATARVGNASVFVSARGCVECGAMESSRWFFARTIGVLIGRQLVHIDLARCNACATPQLRQLEMLPIGGS